MKVLIAEDEPVSRKRLQSYLERWGHEVTAASGGGEAWRLFEGNHFPIVISDWMMPEMDGPELVRRIRNCPRPGYVYVILLTARSEKEDVVTGMEAGADDFVTKPFDREELRVRLRAGERTVQLEHNLAEQNQVLREAQAALIQSEKLASLGRLAAGVAHEINNPISYVSNNLTVLERDTQALLDAFDAYKQGDKITGARLEEEGDLPYFREHYRHIFAKSLEGLRRVAEIVRNLRDFARVDEAEAKEIDLNAALQSTLEILRHDMANQKIQLVTQFELLPPVFCRPAKINQVFLNLLDNAFRACESGGTVTVRTLTDGPHHVLIDVEDTGCGIKPELRPRLFEPFFTTRPVGEGTGLGLSVSFGIIRDHAGNIEVESELGRGSTFRIRLPVQPDFGAKRAI